MKTVGTLYLICPVFINIKCYSSDELYTQIQLKYPAKIHIELYNYYHIFNNKNEHKCIIFSARNACSPRKPCCPQIATLTSLLPLEKPSHMNILFPEICIAVT